MNNIDLRSCGLEFFHNKRTKQQRINFPLKNYSRGELLWIIVVTEMSFVHESIVVVNLWSEIVLLILVVLI